MEGYHIQLVSQYKRNHSGVFLSFLEEEHNKKNLFEQLSSSFLFPVPSLRPSLTLKLAATTMNDMKNMLLLKLFGISAILPINPINQLNLSESLLFSPQFDRTLTFDDQLHTGEWIELQSMRSGLRWNKTRFFFKIDACKFLGRANTRRTFFLDRSRN